jgi:hypothetical protein
VGTEDPKVTAAAELLQARRWSLDRRSTCRLANRFGQRLEVIA